MMNSSITWKIVRAGATSIKNIKTPMQMVTKPEPDMCKIILPNVIIERIIETPCPSPVKINIPPDIKIEKQELSKTVTCNTAQVINIEPKSKQELLEYMIQNDGTVICKICGEILQSRTHWYRHKYKVHLPNASQPTPLYQCEQCNAYFKSRKGYIGHVSSRHSTPSVESQQNSFDKVESNHEEDMAVIVKCDSVNKDGNKSEKLNRIIAIHSNAYENQRAKEERLVTDIINRVRRECEAQGSSNCYRRGYNRRPTIMNTN